MRSAVQGAVLSLVIERPSYGGEIGRRFEDRYDGLLASQRQHVYEALEQLQADELIEPVVLEEADGPVREGYRATAKGARAYQRWLRRPILLSKDSRRQILIRFASARDDDVATVEYLLDCYEQAVLAVARRRPLQSSSAVDRALDEERRTLSDAKLRWIAWARDDLRSRTGLREP